MIVPIGMPIELRLKPPPELIASILKGGIERGTEAEGIINLQIRLIEIRKPIFRRARTMGVTTLGKQPIATGYWFVNQCLRDPVGVAGMAGHIIHEWLHVAGFSHKGGNSAREDVPYVIGNLVKELISNGATREKTAFDVLFEQSLGVEGEVENIEKDSDKDPDEMPM